MEKQRLKILFISSWYPNKNSPTLGNFVEKHAKAASLFADIMVLHVVFSTSPQNKRFQFDFIIENEISVLRIYISNKKSRISVINSLARLYFYFSAYHKGYKILKQKFGKPDLIHANILYPVGIIALLFNNVYKIPYIFTEHWTGYMPDDPNNMSEIRKLISRMVASKALRILPVSEDLKYAMIKMEINGVYQVVPNVIDTNLFKIKPKNDKSEKFRFIHISSLDDKQKNISGILRTVKQLSLNRNDFELLIISDGEADYFFQNLNELNIPENLVRLEKNKSTSEVAESLQNSDCLLMFSNYESFSVVIAEALACGIPVIATKAGGLANELTPEYGIIINKGNEIALVNSMNQMISDYDSYNKSKIAAFAERFSYESVGSILNNIYNETAIRHA